MLVCFKAVCIVLTSLLGFFTPLAVKKAENYQTFTFESPLSSEQQHLYNKGRVKQMQLVCYK